MPQVKANSPFFSGVNSTTTGSFRGKSRFIANSGIAILVPQVFFDLADERNSNRYTDSKF